MRIKWDKFHKPLLLCLSQANCSGEKKKKMFIFLPSSIWTPVCILLWLLTWSRGGNGELVPFCLSLTWGDTATAPGSQNMAASVHHVTFMGPWPLQFPGDGHGECRPDSAFFREKTVGLSQELQSSVQTAAGGPQASFLASMPKIKMSSCF